MRALVAHAAAAALLFSSGLTAQGSKKLTLAEAEAAAVKNHPNIASATAQQQAVAATIQQNRSALYPSITGNVTGAGADHSTTLSAGNVTTSSLFTRFAAGVQINQLVTDFGRTSNLAGAAQLRAGAQDETVHFTRAQVLLRVRQGYFRSLAAQAVLRVARQTVDARRLTLRQVTALANSNLKSSLDVSFADVNLSEAELTLFRAENDLRSAFTELNAAMGLSQEQAYELVEETMPGPLAEKPEPLIGEALQQRPDLAGLRLSHQAALKFAEGERRLQYPTLSVIAAAGVLPARDERLRGHYDAAALNLSIPVLNGGLFSARRSEADAKARVAEEDVRSLELSIARDVKLAWLNAENAFRRLDVTARLFDQANRSLRLAQSRYDLGLSSIVELTQAQLNQTSAEIANANARYEYQAARSALDYETGLLK